MEKQVVMEISEVSKRYQDRLALDRVSFDLRQGEISGLLGPNGAGKTTLMRIIVGLTKNYQGAIQFSSLSEKLKIGCVIETPSFYPHMTGQQNIDFFAALAGGVNKWKVQEMINLLGLSDAMNKKVKSYSLGMRQRLGIIQSLLGNPDILILDEPTNGLDPQGVKEIREYLVRISKEKQIPILISSHILSEIEKICDRVVILQNGRLVESIDMAERNQQNSSFYLIATIQISECLAFLETEKIKVIQTDSKSITIKVDKSDYSAFIRKLAASELAFTNICEKNQTLEEKFLDLTGGK
ncbi:ABC transporter ATP-binding protein [Carnobacterium gallinarum]|uniref:ABC transporter ATP-binding protein n=1 Tax=Carnobacterium gallinarum TaxID=2749 RepID=UPI00068DB475|nr:ABC transporter ATP-binding protein [Carnobacterium gallinarum]